MFDDTKFKICVPFLSECIEGDFSNDGTSCEQQNVLDSRDTQSSDFALAQPQLYEILRNIVPPLFQDFFLSSIHAPQTNYENIDILQASPGVAILIAGLGYIMLVPRGWSTEGGDRLHDIEAIFPNHSRLLFKVKADTARGSVSPHRNYTEGVFVAADGGRHSVNLTAVPSSARAIRFTGAVFGELTLNFNVTPLPRVSRHYVTLQARQEDFKGNADPLLKTARDSSPTVEIAAVAPVNKATIIASAAAVLTYEIYLSNGDLIELRVEANHHAAGYVKVLSAKLQPFADPTNWKSLSFSPASEMRGGGTVTLNGEGYSIAFPVTPPAQTQGLPQLGDGSIRSAPPPKFQAVTHLPQKEYLFDATQGVELLPTDETQRILTNRRWESGPIILTFTGQFGERVVSEMAPLALNGHFEGGKFVLDVSEELTTTAVDRGIVLVESVIIENDSGLALRVFHEAGSSGGEFIDVPMTRFGVSFGFSTDSTGLKRKLLARYSADEVHGAIPEVAQWNRASAKLRAEISRMFSRSSTAWQNEDVVMVSRENPDIIRVQTAAEKPLYFRRSESGDRVSYSTLSGPNEEEHVRVLSSQINGTTALHGLLVGNVNNGGQLIEPFRGRPEVIPGDDTHVIFADQNLRSIQISQSPHGLQISFPKNLEPFNVGAVLAGVQEDGYHTLVYEAESGGAYRVELPPGMDYVEAQFTLLFPEELQEDPTPSLKVIFVDAAGIDAHETQLNIKNGQWVGTNASGQEEAFVFDERTGRLPELRIVQPSPEVVEAVEAPILKAARKEEGEAAPTARTVERPVTAVTPRFPWQEHQFMLPAGDLVDRRTDEPLLPADSDLQTNVGNTRTLMRQAFRPDPTQRPKEGQQEVFTFLGEPYGTDVAIDAFLTMKARGARAYKFMGWVIQIDFVYRDGQWVPDPHGQIRVDRRFPKYGGSDGRQIVGYDYWKELGGVFPTRVVNIGTGFALEIAPNRRIQFFRASPEGQSLRLSHDMGISLGEPTPAAIALLKKIGEKTGGAYYEVIRPPIRPSAIAAMTQDARPILVVPEFGDPFIRGSAFVHSNVTVVELLPGMASHLPLARFSQLRIYDQNGFNASITFQHNEADAQIVAFEASGQRLDLGSLGITVNFNGRVVVNGIVPASYHFVGGDRRTHHIPLALEFHQEGDVFRLLRLDIGEQRLDLSGQAYTYDRGTWKNEEHIFQYRSTAEVAIGVKRIEGAKLGGGRPGTAGSKGKAFGGKQEIAVPHDHAVLARGHQESGGLFHDITAEYELEGEEARHRFHLQLTYDERHRVYRPKQVGERRNSVIALEIDGALSPVNCVETLTGRNWRLTLNDGSTLYLGNFYVNESDEGERRPIPVMWTSTGRDPHRRLVVRHLEENSLAPPVFQRQTLDPLTQSSLELPFKESDARYRVGVRVVSLPDGKLAVVPKQSALCSKDGGETWAPQALRYYIATESGSPAVLELDGRAYELSVDGSRLNIKKTHPGAAALYSEYRARKMVLVEPEGNSGVLLLDYNEDRFVQLVAEAKASGEHIHRILEDAITGEQYEFVFSARADLHGSSMLRLEGVAHLTEGGPENIGKNVLVTNTRIFVQTDDGRYLSFSPYPGTSLQVTSHNRVLEVNLVGRVWQALNKTFSSFANAPAQFDYAHLQRYYDIPANRLRTQTDVAAHFGVEPTLIWDTEKTWPRGMMLRNKEGFDPDRPRHRKVERGPLAVEFDFDGRYPHDIRVTYYGEVIPYDYYIHPGGGRPYLCLRGPLSGVIFYFDRPSRGISSLKEITHPVLRETLEQEAGHDAMSRPTSVDFTYPPQEGEIGDALRLQLRRSRLHQLEAAGALPPSPGEQHRLAELLGTDVAVGDHPSDAYRVIHQIAQEVTMRSTLETILSGLANDRINLADCEPLFRAWDAWRTLSPTAPEVVDMLGRVTHELNALAAQSEVHVAAAGQSTRALVIVHPLPASAVREWIASRYGRDLAERILPPERTGDVTLEELARDARMALGDTGATSLDADIRAWERTHPPLSVFAEMAIVLERLDFAMHRRTFTAQASADRMIDLEKWGRIVILRDLRLPAEESNEDRARAAYFELVQSAVLQENFSAPHNLEEFLAVLDIDRRDERGRAKPPGVLWQEIKTAVAVHPRYRTLLLSEMKGSERTIDRAIERDGTMHGLGGRKYSVLLEGLDHHMAARASISYEPSIAVSLSDDVNATFTRSRDAEEARRTQARERRESGERGGRERTGRDGAFRRKPPK